MRIESKAPGFSLVELLIVTVVAGLMLAAVYQTLIVQQQGYRQQTAVTNARQTTRAGLEILAAELREVSATQGDILMAGPDSIRFRAYRKAGLTCEPGGGGINKDVIYMGNAFAFNDSIVVFVDDNPDNASDDSWVIGQINNAPSAATSCSGWGGYGIQRIQSNALNDARIRIGAPIRAFATVGYGRVQVDGEWTLARYHPTTAALLGPLPAPPATGLRFRYFDAAGNEFTPTSQAQRDAIARIEILVRGMSRGTASPTNPEIVDSLTMQVMLRGN